MLDFQVEQVNQEHFVVEGHYDLVESDLELLYLRAKVHISDYLLRFFKA